MNRDTRTFIWGLIILFYGCIYLGVLGAMFVNGKLITNFLVYLGVFLALSLIVNGLIKIGKVTD